MCRSAPSHFWETLTISVLYVVQLGGLEPPTSCSTDRRSNQLSYNCILARSLKWGSANGAETRCNAPLWQGRESVNCARKTTSQTKSPGCPPGLLQTQNADRSGGRLVKLRRAGLDRLDGL